MPVILFHGSKYSGVIILVLFLLFQVSLLSQKNEIQQEIKNKQKEYSLILEELERKNDFALQDK